MDEGKTYFSTTNIAFVFNEGIIAATDTRATRRAIPGKPDKILSNLAKKIKYFKHCLTNLSGDGAYCCECQKLLREISDKAPNGQDIPIRSAAQDVGHLFHGHTPDKFAQCLISGFEEGVGKIYHVQYNGKISTSTEMKGLGSGKNYALQILANEYSKELNVTEAIALARRAIIWACINDWQTGGEITVFYINKNGEVHEESYETEMNRDLKKAEEARIKLGKKFEEGEFDVGNLVQYVKYVRNDD